MLEMQSSMVEMSLSLSVFHFIKANTCSCSKGEPFHCSPDYGACFRIWYVLLVNAAETEIMSDNWVFFVWSHNNWLNNGETCQNNKLKVLSAGSVSLLKGICEAAEKQNCRTKTIIFFQHIWADD